MLLVAVLPVYLKDLGGSDSAVGLVVGVFALSALFPRPFVGREIDRGGSRRFILAGAAIFVVASALYIVATTVPLLLGVRILHGVGLALFTTAALAMVADLAPPSRRGEMLGIWGTAPTFASAIAPFFGLMIRDHYGYDTVFIVSTCCALLALVLVRFLRDPHKEVRADAADAGLIEKSVLFPAVLVISMTFIFGAVSSFVLLFAEERGIENAGLFFTATAGAVVLSRLLGGKLSDRYGRWKIILPSMACLSAGVALLSQATSLTVLLLGAGLIGLSFGSGFPALSALAVDVAPSGRRGAAMGTYSASFEVGAGAGAIIMGLVATVTGYATMFLIGSAFPAGGVLFAWARTRSGRASSYSGHQRSTAD